MCVMRECMHPGLLGLPCFCDQVAEVVTVQVLARCCCCCCFMLGGGEQSHQVLEGGEQSHQVVLLG